MDKQTLENAVLKKLSFVLFLAVSSVVVTNLAVASPQTLTGTVTDTICGKKHMVPGKSDTDCVRECMKSKGSWTYGLLVGDKVYSLSGNAKTFDALAGQQVKITGEVSGSKIAVTAIEPLSK